MDEILPSIFSDQWRVIIIASAVLLLAAEVGFRLGLGLYRSKDEARKGQIGGVQSAVLGVLGLLLGFTFAMEVNLYQNRRDLILQEANSIGTTFLRASLLPETHRASVQDLLRRYVNLRLEFYKAGADVAQQNDAEQSAAEIQRELWAHTVEAARESPTPTVATFINSLNETIDFDATRLNALRTRVPAPVWLLVLGVAIGGCCATGYAAGSSGARSSFSDVVLPLLIAVVITLIADIGRPRSGLIRINQQPMLDLQTNLSRELPLEPTGRPGPPGIER
jgi:hypothetical protein